MLDEVGIKEIVKVFGKVVCCVYEVGFDSIEFYGVYGYLIV